jgi:dihydrofolate reductase
MGKPIVMGRKTWDSIGRPLPGRQNIVITRQAGFVAEGCDVVTSADEAIAVTAGADEVMVIGGSQVYSLFLPNAERLYLTRVHAEVAGDTFFPQINESQWRLVNDETHSADDRNAFDYSFRTYERAAT